MWSTALPITLLLTAANLITGAALPPGLSLPNPRIPGLSLTCQRIPSSQPAAPRLPNIRHPTTARSLSRRVLPYCVEGVLNGDEHSYLFALKDGQAWTLYWTVDRLVLAGRVELWRTQRNVLEEVDSTPMANRESRPFTPEAGWEYFVDFVGASMGRISWYMATQ